MYFLTPNELAGIGTLDEFPAEIDMSFDLGISTRSAQIYPDRIEMNEICLPFPPVAMVKGDDRSILICREDSWEKWQRYDDDTGRFYKMIFVESGKPPTVEISGIKMHVTKDSDPQRDTASKLRALGKAPHDRVLDTCFGLGYTALALSNIPAVSSVTTIEIDPNMLALAEDSPWSRPVFQSDAITIAHGDAADKIREFPDNHFTAIIHDPPRFAMAPQLYELQFYEQCFRVLQKRGKIYHYTGNPNQKTRKTSLPEKTMERFRAAGFRRVQLDYQGVVAIR